MRRVSEQHHTPTVAFLFSGQRRTFAAVEASLVTNLQLSTTGSSAVFFDCSEGGSALSHDSAGASVRSAPPWSINFITERNFHPCRHVADPWKWPSSSTEVLVQFERNHRCYMCARSFERIQGSSFSAMIKVRPDLFMDSATDLFGSLQRTAPGSILARARCWPDGKLPRQSWTYGHTRCGREALPDDAFFVVRREDADAVFGRWDRDLLGSSPDQANSIAWPRCDVRFKASIVAECVFKTHLRRRNISFVPTLLPVAIARLASDGSGSVHVEGRSGILRSAEPPGASAASPALVACATNDRKGVCRVALPFVAHLLTSFGKARCQDAPAVIRNREAGQSPPPLPLSSPEWRAIVGCDNAPAVDFDSALAKASPACRARLTAQHSIGGASSSIRRISIHVLKEPRSISERFYAQSAWGLGRRPVSAKGGPAEALLVIDSFGSGVDLAVAAVPILSIPWASLTYASRHRPPSDLAWPPGARVASWPMTVPVRGNGQSASRKPKLCVFLGHNAGEQALRFHVNATGLDALAPGYHFRDELVRHLGCSTPRPNDRNRIHHDADGPLQTGPFEGTLPHYAGFRFVVAVENTDIGTPVSEKIINAYLAGAIPIVWGGGAHRHIFNPKSFVDCTEISAGRRSATVKSSTVEACAARVLAVDGNETKRRAMATAPRFASRQAYESFFAWRTADHLIRNSSAQKQLHDWLASRFGAALGCK